jgi:hypothetical protein
MQDAQFCRAFVDQLVSDYINESAREDDNTTPSQHSNVLNFRQHHARMQDVIGHLQQQSMGPEMPFSELPTEDNGRVRTLEEQVQSRLRNEDERKWYDEIMKWCQSNEHSDEFFKVYPFCSSWHYFGMFSPCLFADFRCVCGAGSVCYSRDRILQE